jgi:hypothetical protein
VADHEDGREVAANLTLRDCDEFIFTGELSRVAPFLRHGRKRFLISHHAKPQRSRRCLLQFPARCLATLRFARSGREAPKTGCLPAMLQHFSQSAFLRGIRVKSVPSPCPRCLRGEDVGISPKTDSADRVGRPTGIPCRRSIQDHPDVARFRDSPKSFSASPRQSGASRSLSASA